MHDPYPGDTIPEKAGNIPPADWHKAMRHLVNNLHGYTAAISIAEAVFGCCHPPVHQKNAEAILYRMANEGLVDATDTPTVWKVSVERRLRILGMARGDI